MSLFQTLQKRRGRVLFVSDGNACRSQIAEAFARGYGEDCLVAFSAGFRRTDKVSSHTGAVMIEKGLPLYRDQHTKDLTGFDLNGFDVIVKMSGGTLPQTSAVVLEPAIPETVDGDLESFRTARDRIEFFVRFLVDHFQRAKDWSPELNREPITAASPQSSSILPPAPVQSAASGAAL